MEDTPHQRSASRARRGLGEVEYEAVRVWMLGGFRVSAGPRTIAEDGWRLRKAASLIKLLALTEGHRLHRELLMASLWPDLDARRAINNLHRVLHYARKALEPAPANSTSRYLALRGDLIELCPDSTLWVDVEAFEDTAATARRRREPAAYRVAIELYAGELLPEDRYEEWAQQRREELRQLHLALLAELAGLHEERGEYELAIQALRRLVSYEPAREETQADLMRLYALSGRRHEALLQYERLQEALREELGVQPRAASRHLYEEIRDGVFTPAPVPSVGRLSGEPADPSRHNLPASLTSFVGREREMLEARRLLSMSSLLTLPGTSGFSLSALASSEYDYEGYVAMARAGLDEKTFEAAWNEGRELSLEEAIEYALVGSDDTPQASDARDHAALDSLTRREQEVATYIGRGLSNRRISSELGITEPTVQTHVSRTLRKLGFHSRTHIAAWILQRPER